MCPLDLARAARHKPSCPDFGGELWSHYRPVYFLFPSPLLSAGLQSDENGFDCGFQISNLFFGTLYLYKEILNLQKTLLNLLKIPSLSKFEKWSLEEVGNNFWVGNCRVVNSLNRNEVL